jgi:hypothetical protein
MKEIFVILALCTTLSLFAQEQEPDRIGHENSDSLLIVSARKQMTNLIWEGRFDTLAVIQEDFEQTHPQFKLVSSSERLLLYFWSESYTDIFRFLQQEEENTLPFYGDEALWNVLLYKTSENIADVQQWIDQANRRDDEIQFLHRLLTDLTKEDEYAVTLQATDNTVATYKKAFSTPKTTEPSSAHHFWYGYSLEAGPSFVSGNIANYFQPKAYGSLNILVMPYRWDFAFMIQFAATQLKQEILLKDNVNYWTKGSTAAFFNLGLTLGYAVIDTKWFRMAPYAGLMLNSISPTTVAMENDEVLEDVSMSSFTACYGVYAQLRLCYMRNMKANLMFTTRVQYTPTKYNYSNIRYQGDICAVMFGLSFWGLLSE